tara:strand:+ start:639 stop:1172 length:534 start_codon:yes stop_codon:yes gene_type:complete
MRCKNCKEIFEPKQFNRKFCTKDECNDLYYKFLLDKMYKKIRKETKAKKEKLKTLQDYMKSAQKVFNSYIRERDKGQPCLMCKNPNPKKVNACHYFSSGGHKAVTFDPMNVHLGCEYCNNFKSGNLIPYRKNLILKIGIEEFEALESRAYETKKYTKEELKQIEKEYKKKLKDLKNK